MYLIIPRIFKLALLLFSQSLKMIKIDRNMTDLSQIVCKQYVFNISLFVGFMLWMPALFVSRSSLHTNVTNSL
jgi:hypothetical protein